MNVYSKIEELMAEKGISRYKLSKDTGIPYSTLTQILNGRTKDPQISALQAIADYFDKSLDYISNNSLGAIIKNRLTEIGITMEELSEQTKIPLDKLQNIDNLQPTPLDYEKDGLLDRLSRYLGVSSYAITSAYARQEPPAYDGPQDKRSIEEIFANEDFNEATEYESPNQLKSFEETFARDDHNEPSQIPEWATSKDARDFKHMLEEDTPVMFDGVPIEGEAKQRVMDVLTGLFWEAKELNKKTYGRKKNKKGPTDNSNG
ncbi:transcriptional regulator with XRE-family HTH domain [Paenibacillus sp. DS2015]|uniref:helix-turn-helix domain-containing protein n=1 Tax=Paenibacillus sp. DS2015 TaxID=3373917 RepID=UPI003D1BF14D